MATDPLPSTHRNQAAGPRLRAWGWLLVAVVLALVFLAYLNPHLAREIATTVWACF